MKRKETKGRKESSFSCFSKSESAAATALAAVLLLALVFTMIAVVKLEYVPDWKNDAERDHMYNTLDDMTGVKTNIDILSRLAKLNNYSSHNISVTVPVDMGGGQIPFLEPSKSGGKLAVNTERCVITIVPNRPALRIEPDNLTLECGGITCYSENRQYPNQTFRYENGALLLANDESSVMRQVPAFIIETNESNCTIRIHAVQLSGKRDSTSSNAVIPLQLTGYKTEPVYDSDEDKDTSRSINAFNMTISTRYPDAWITYLNETAQDQGLNSTDYTVQYLKGSGHVRFSFLPNGNKTLDRLCVNKTIIGVELGSGDNFGYNYSPGSTENVMKLNQWYQFDTFTGTYEGASISTDPDMLKDRDEDYSLPAGSLVNEQLISYSEVNDFNYSMEKNGKTLDLDFGFNSFSSFNSTSVPTKADVCMIYSFDNKDKKNNKKPKIEINFPGNKIGTSNPEDGWCLYNRTLEMSPEEPEDMTLNLKVTTDNGDHAKGTFRIDYLAVRPN